jgi:hypothetical protein
MVDHRSNQHRLNEHDSSIGSTAATPLNVELDSHEIEHGLAIPFEAAKQLFPLCPAHLSDLD